MKFRSLLNWAQQQVLNTDRFFWEEILEKSSNTEVCWLVLSINAVPVAFNMNSSWITSYLCKSTTCKLMANFKAKASNCRLSAGISDLRLTPLVLSETLKAEIRTKFILQHRVWEISRNQPDSSTKTSGWASRQHEQSYLFIKVKIKQRGFKSWAAFELEDMIVISGETGKLAAHQL